MEYIKHNINFTITNGTTNQFASTFAAKIIDYLVGTIGLNLIKDDVPENSSRRYITLQYKDRKPYINIGIREENVYGYNGYTRKVHVSLGASEFDGSFKEHTEQEIINTNLTYTFNYEIIILKSDNFFCITQNIDRIRTIGNYGVIFCNVKNLSSEESLDAFAGNACTLFFSATSSSTALIQYVGEDAFESIGYAIKPDTSINFVNNRVILLPALLSQNHSNILYYDWYVDELLIVLNKTFTVDSKLEINNKTYLAITDRCLVEIERSIVD